MEGSVIPTLKDVAKEAGVSTATVSHVVNNTRYVSPEVEARVNNAIKKVNYRPNIAARCLKTNKTAMFGVVVCTYDNSFHSELLFWINSICQEKNYSTLVSYISNAPGSEKQAIMNLVDRGVDGLIINSVAPEEDIEDFLNELDTPFVLMNRFMKKNPGDTIHTDDFNGGKIAVEHLLSLGHTRIGLISIASNPVFSDSLRIDGYKEALSKAGIDFDEDLVFLRDYQAETGMMAFNHFMSLENPPTALFCCSDVIAMGAVKAANLANIKIPEDISIIGYDDFIYADYMVPSLTTIAQNKEKLGVGAVELLLERVNKKRTDRVDFSVKPELIVRESTEKLKIK